MSSDRAQARLMQVRDELDELLSDNGMELAGNATGLDLRHIATGEDLHLGTIIP